MSDVSERLAALLDSNRVLTGEQISADYTHDEALGAEPAKPDVVVLPRDTAEVARVVALAAELGVPVTARGSGSGMSGASIPRKGGILISFGQMNAIVDIDTDNHVAVVQPGITLAELDQATAAHGLVYPVFPGELHASLGGNVGTNAGGMRAVKYGVTRHHVLGVEAVLGTGEVIRSGGKFVKTSTGYDLTQLIVGSEGSLAIVTEVILKLQPRLSHTATVLVPFTTLDDVTAAIPRIVQSGLAPMLLEYIDLVSMSAIVTNAGIDLGIPQQVKDSALAYLVVVLESRVQQRLDEDLEELGEMLGELHAIDVYVLDGRAGEQLIDAREKAFFAAKAAGADDIIDMVVPRAQLPSYLSSVSQLAERTGSLVFGCGHAGDGNVHLSIFQPDEKQRYDVLHGIFAAGMQLGGAISGEHGIGTEKMRHVLELEDPAKLALMRRIKAAFDPAGILNPGLIYDIEPPTPGGTA
ncbi:MAG TPA: FAD-linked oxidase C-terminal domain-containing protein [Mycobacteriales bacterium]|nr:FAD-linked oxidase C-terminal domain-containing protein [Mycobacteriales bacterium]